MEKYRILQIHNFYQIPGGEDVVVRNEKKLLEEHGHEVFTYYRSNKELNEGNKLKKLFIPFTAVYSLKTCREVKKIIRENKIDIVHVHNTLMMVSPSVFYAAFQCKVPVVQTLHNFRMLCPAGSFFRNNVICEECVDGGLKCAREFILTNMEKIINDSIKGKIFRDYKTCLQEVLQSNGENNIWYKLIEEKGPDHNKRFVMEVGINDTVLGVGEGKSKKDAEQVAAKCALDKKM